MDLRTQTSLVGAIVAFAIVASVLLRTQKRTVHWLFVLFGANVTLWYLTNFLDHIAGGPVWQRANAIFVILLPQGALQFFRAFLPTPVTRAKRMSTVAIVAGALLLPLTFTPWQRHPVVGAVIFTYVVGLLGAALWLLWSGAAHVDSRFDRARIRYLTIVGALAALSTVVDFLPRVGLDIPPVGTVLTLVFLFVLSQSILRYRLLDLYELAGRLAVLTALAFSLAGIFWILVYVAGGRFFLHAVLAGLVVLLLFDPLRAKVEEQIAQVFFRERYELERAAADLRRRLAHVLEVEEMTRIVVADLERSRRVTHASVYLIDVDRRGYELTSHLGPQPVARLEAAAIRPLLQRLRAAGSVTRESIEREMQEKRDLGDERDVETLLKILEILEQARASVCLAIESERIQRAEDPPPYGLLCVGDERLRDAFSPEEVALLQSIAAQAAIAVENSELYQRMKQRDRLAALGEMAAGLAHEIRNPLGAIKGAAQYLAEPATEEPEAAGGREFLDIIVEEVDRLNRVVTSFLDYARPPTGNPSAVDINATVERTLRVLGLERTHPDVRLRCTLAPDLPAVRVDTEQLRQVLINLVQNATQAMEGRGELAIETRARSERRAMGTTERASPEMPSIVDLTWVELRVADTGPGIAKAVLTKLFIPFFTTKDKGSGLGLAISQRIVEAAGGTIDVHTTPGVGSVFVVRLPAAEPSARISSPEPSAAAPRVSAPEPATAAPAADAAAPAAETRAQDETAAPAPTSRGASA